MSAAEQIERGDFVVIPERYSKKYKHLIPAIRGVVRAVRPERDEIDVVEFKTHGTRTARLEKARLMTGRQTQLEKHITEITEIPRFKSPGNRDLPEVEEVTPLGELVAERYIEHLHSRRRSQMAAKKTDNGSTGEKPKGRKSRAASLEGVSPEDFFTENAKGKQVFRPGWDAKLAGCIKRVINGKGDKEDARIVKSKVIRNSEKVANSEHFQHLFEQLDQAQA